MLAAGLVFLPASLQAQPAPSGSSRSLSLTTEERSRVTFDAYILGPGDGLEIELLDLPALSGRFTIGPDGTIYLPQLRALYVEGLTIEELRLFLTDQFRPTCGTRRCTSAGSLSPHRVYVGEVARLLLPQW